jgi:phosphatidylserine decarboxylase
MALERWPNAAMSRAFGILSERRFPPAAQTKLNLAFARAVGIRLEESELELQHYPTLNAFFTRRLKEGTHRLDPNPEKLIAPVDGVLRDFGRIDSERLVQAKGLSYSVKELLNHDPLSAHFERKAFATFYLSPRDYHRIHSPCSGEILAHHYVPGSLFPVNALGLHNIDELFCRNERLITFVRSGQQHLAIVKVGATCVGRISATACPFISNQGQTQPERSEWETPPSLERGDEVGVFNLGSTVVLLFGQADFVFEPDLRPGQHIRMGTAIGSWAQPS